MKTGRRHAPPFPSCEPATAPDPCAGWAAISGCRQVAEVLNLIRRLRDRGIAIVFISHRMPDVFSIADRLVVLRRGRKVADKDVAASSPEEVTGLITGAIEHVL